MHRLLPVVLLTLATAASAQAPDTSYSMTLMFPSDPVSVDNATVGVLEVERHCTGLLPVAAQDVDLRYAADVPPVVVEGPMSMHFPQMDCVQETEQHEQGQVAVRLRGATNDTLAVVMVQLDSGFQDARAEASVPITAAPAAKPVLEEVASERDAPGASLLLVVLVGVVAAVMARRR